MARADDACERSPSVVRIRAHTMIGIQVLTIAGLEIISRLGLGLSLGLSLDGVYPPKASSFPVVSDSVHPPKASSLSSGLGSCWATELCFLFRSECSWPAPRC